MPRTFTLNANGELASKPNHISQDIWNNFTQFIKQENATNPLAILASDLTFGVEIETHIDTRSGLNVGGWHSGHTTPSLPTFEGRRWGVERDGSIRIAGGEYRTGAEFISPILKGRAGLENLLSVVRKIKAPVSITSGESVDSHSEAYGFDARVNDSCGVHIHVGFPTHDLKALQRLASLVASLECGIYASTGSTRRRNGTYSRPIKDIDRKRSAIRTKSRVDFESQWGMDRYYGLNLDNLISGRRPTVEFRFFSGSLNPIKIAAWTQMCLGLVQLALSSQRSAPWDSKPAPRWYGKDKTQSEREVQRLMQKIGWVYKRDNNTFGTLGVLGEVENGLPTRRSMVREMRRLARSFAESNGETAN